MDGALTLHIGGGQSVRIPADYLGKSGKFESIFEEFGYILSRNILILIVKAVRVDKVAVRAAETLGKLIHFGDERRPVAVRDVVCEGGRRLVGALEQQAAEHIIEAERFTRLEAAEGAARAVKLMQALLRHRDGGGQVAAILEHYASGHYLSKACGR